MAISICPNSDCEKPIDIDGYVVHGVRTLFYCECGEVYDMSTGFGKLTKVPTNEIDLTGLDGIYPSQNPCDANFNKGIFIKKTRWSNYNESNESE